MGVAISMQILPIIFFVYSPGCVWCVWPHHMHYLVNLALRLHVWTIKLEGWTGPRTKYLERKKISLMHCPSYPLFLIDLELVSLIHKVVRN